MTVGDTPDPKTALVTLGMPASGEAALAQLMSAAGAHLPRGDLAAINDGLLGVAGGAWDEIFASPAAPDDGLLRRAADFLTDGFEDRPDVIALADPRAARLAPVWTLALESAGYRPVYIILVRDPRAVAQALQASEGLAAATGELLWLSQMLEAERETRGAARIFVTYDDLRADWRAVLARIEALTGRAAPEPDAVQTRAIETALAVDAGPPVANAPAGWSGVGQAYERLRAAARGGELDTARLDAIGAALGSVGDVAGPALADARRELARARRFRELQDRAIAAQAEVLQRELTVSRGLTDQARGQFEMVVAARRAEAEAFAAEREWLRADAANQIQAGAERARLQLDKVKADAARREAEHLAAAAVLRGEMTVELGQARQEAARVLADLVAMRESRLWRMTAPARRLASVGKRVLGRRVPAAIASPAMDDRALVRSSGLFDDDWYRETYPDVAAAGADPLDHFMTTGWREDRQPGPGFDGRYYRAVHPDVAREGGNPLLHYLRHGHAEGRPPLAGAGWSAPAQSPHRETLPFADVDPPRATPRVVVAVHAFYPDVFDEICQQLAAFPGPFTLLVSTPTEAGRKASLKSISRHRMNAAADIRVTPNRGRNFGPLVSVFGPTILEHDLLLHLHTKKSLYTASERTAWRDDLYGALLGDRANLKTILGLFEARPDVGLVYPPIFADMPYWANHWLQNAHLAPGLFTRLGVAAYAAEGYIDYPVGGMFWGRVEALKPLFEAGFTQDDFPEEAGQTDGTLAHAIERCVVDLARSRGFTFAEADQGERAFRIGWSDKNLAQYAHQTPARLRAAIDAADIVSFDLFDTLITRPSLSPDAVQRYVGLILAARHPDAPDFFTERKAAELRARIARDWTGDVTHPEIYAAFDAAWSEALKAEALVLECAIEARIVLTRPSVVEGLAYARAQGKRVLLVSDTYFEPSTIAALLAAAGIAEDAVDGVHLSSQIQARKDRGDIWARLAALEDAQGKRWLHIGDNEVSDIQRVSDLGMQAFHVMNPAVLLAQKGFLPLDLAADWRAAIVLGPAAARLGADPFPPGGALGAVEINDPRSLGYAVFGPAIFAFVAWLANRPETTGLGKLHFLAREGWVLHPAYEALRAARPDRALPPSGYLYASRRCVMMASQAVSFDPDVAVRGSGGFYGEFGKLTLARLGFAVTGPEALEHVALPGDAPAVRGKLRDRETEIVAQARGELDACRRYLIAQGVGETSGVVDVGYSATIQKGLQTILGHGLAGFYMATFADAAEVAQAGGSAAGAFGDGVAPGDSASAIAHALVLEAFLTAPHGQVDHFVIGDDGAEPVFKPSRLTVDEAALLAQMHAGAVAYVEDLMAFYGPEVADLAVDPEAALAPLKALAEGRVRALPELLAVLKVDDAFCGHDELAVGASLAARA